MIHWALLLTVLVFQDGKCSIVDHDKPLDDRQIFSQLFEGYGTGMGRMPRRRGRSPVDPEQLDIYQGMRQPLTREMGQIPQMPDGFPKIPENLPFPPQMPSPPGRKRRSLGDMEQLPQMPKMPDGLPNPMPIPGRKRREAENPVADRAPNPMPGQKRQVEAGMSGLTSTGTTAKSYAKVPIPVFIRGRRSAQDSSSPIETGMNMMASLPKAAIDAAGAAKDAASSAFDTAKDMAKSVMDSGTSLGGMVPSS